MDDKCIPSEQEQAVLDQIVCLGGATVDRKYLSRRPLRAGTSNPVTSRRSFGGVARNVAETLSRLGAPSSLVSLVGDDENGRSLVWTFLESALTRTWCSRCW